MAAHPTPATPAVRVRRVYDGRESADGRRILVDRIWPRGLRKEDADLDEWAKDVAPSTELRRWYRHDPEKFAEFRGRYLDELRAGPAQVIVDRLAGLIGHGPLTLLTASRDLDHSQARVLADVLIEVTAR
jgi:uncharacterized protein YeaO (DUF488 family)